jgi:hypothetical protein
MAHDGRCHRPIPQRPCRLVQQVIRSPWRCLPCFWLSSGCSHSMQRAATRCPIMWSLFNAIGHINGVEAHEAVGAPRNLFGFIRRYVTCYICIDKSRRRLFDAVDLHRWCLLHRRENDALKSRTCALGCGKAARHLSALAGHVGHTGMVS